MSGQLVKGCELVFEFDAAKLSADCRDEFTTAVGGSAIVDGEHGVATLGHQLIEGIGNACRPLVLYDLCGRAAVDIHDEGNLGACLRVGR